MNRKLFEVKKEYECDLLVCGGGVSGIAAAVSAARQGAKVILCELNGFLGGTATAGLVAPFMTCYDAEGKNRIIRGFFDEFVDRLISEGGAISHTLCPGGDSRSGYRLPGHIGVTPINAECVKTVAEDFCIEAGVKLLYHSRVVECETQDNIIKKVYISTPAGIESIEAKIFIDASGNAALCEKAGAKTFFGDETGFVQTASLFFKIDGVDKQKLDEHCLGNEDMRSKFYMDKFKAAREEGRFPCGCEKLRIYECPDGSWAVNMAQEDRVVVDFDTEDLTQAEISQRKQIKEIFKFLKAEIPGLENIRMLESAGSLGVRESRRMLGKTLLCKEDLINSNYYDERIAVCANSIDVHNKVNVEYVPCKREYYIPLSCLVSENIENLMGIGKCVSADKYAFAAIRVMPPCFAMGQAAGTTAAMAIKNKTSICKVAAQDVQNQIIKDGGYL